MSLPVFTKLQDYAGVADAAKSLFPNWNTNEASALVTNDLELEDDRYNTPLQMTARVVGLVFNLSGVASPRYHVQSIIVLEELITALELDKIPLGRLDPTRNFVFGCLLATKYDSIIYEGYVHNWEIVFNRLREHVVRKAIADFVGHKRPFDYESDEAVEALETLCEQITKMYQRLINVFNVKCLPLPSKTDLIAENETAIESMLELADQMKMTDDPEVVELKNLTKNKKGSSTTKSKKKVQTNDVE